MEKKIKPKVKRHQDSIALRGKEGRDDSARSMKRGTRSPAPLDHDLVGQASKKEKEVTAV